MNKLHPTPMSAKCFWLPILAGIRKSFRDFHLASLTMIALTPWAKGFMCMLHSFPVIHWGTVDWPIVGAQTQCVHHETLASTTGPHPHQPHFNGFVGIYVNSDPMSNSPWNIWIFPFLSVLHPSNWLHAGSLENLIHHSKCLPLHSRILSPKDPATSSICGLPIWKLPQIQELNEEGIMAFHWGQWPQPLPSPFLLPYWL